MSPWLRPLASPDPAQTRVGTVAAGSPQRPAEGRGTEGATRAAGGPPALWGPLPLVVAPGVRGQHRMPAPGAHEVLAGT